MSSHFCTLGLIAVTTVPLAACRVGFGATDAVIRDEKRFTVSGNPDVTLGTFDGSIEVRSWNRPEVLVTTEKHGADRQEAERLDVLSTQDGNRIHVEATR